MFAGGLWSFAGGLWSLVVVCGRLWSLLVLVTTLNNTIPKVEPCGKPGIIILHELYDFYLSPLSHLS